jgi:hypothetical protein
MLDDNTRQALRQLLPALQALAKSVERALLTETYRGTSGMAVKSYRSLQGKVAELLPNDHYVTDALTLEVTADASEREKVAQVQLAVSQLVNYLEGLVRRSGKSGEFEDLSDLGRELRERILATTRDAVKRAMANVDIDMEIDDREPWGTKSKRRIVIKGTGDKSENDDEQVDIEVEMDDDDEPDKRNL